MDIKRIQINNVDLSKAQDKIDLANTIRDRVHNLDPKNKDHAKDIDKDRIAIIQKLEGTECKVYRDNSPSRYLTIGCGFNMEAPGAEDVFNRVLGNEVDKDGNKLEFSKVIKGEQEITENHAGLLLKYALDTRQVMLKNN